MLGSRNLDESLAMNGLLYLLIEVVFILLSMLREMTLMELRKVI